MDIKQKKFVHGKEYSPGKTYYKPLEKFAKFGTSGIRWLVEGAAVILAGMQDKIKYYISVNYKRTSGSKETLAEDFSMPNIGIVIKSIALYNLQKAEGAYPAISGDRKDFKDRLFSKGLLVMYDNRPGNFDNAQESAKILAAYGIKAVLARSDGKYTPTPLPAVSRLVQKSGYAGSITFTASHNGDEWNGIKFEAEDGAAADPKITDAIQNILAEELALKDPAKPVAYDIVDEPVETLIKEGMADTVDTLEFYADEIAKYLDMSAIKKAIKEGRVEFIYSAFFGSSGPAMIKLFKKLGLPTDNIIETHKSADQGYVASYEPAMKKLVKLVAAVKYRGDSLKAKGVKTVVIGGAADNDADRFQVNQYNRTTASVEEFTPEKLSAVFGHYLSRYKKFKGPFGRSFVSGTLQDEVAKLFGQTTIETATGFKFSPKVLVQNGGVLFAEESYGISFNGWTLDKDGILPSLLALELVAVTGKSLDEYYNDMLKELEKSGLVSNISFKRYDQALEESVKVEAIKRFAAVKNDVSFGGQKIVKRYDPKEYDGGMKFVLADGSWVAFRSSGTEPIIRMYVEARSEEEREELKALAFKLVGITDAQEKRAAAVVSQKLHTVLSAKIPEDEKRLLQGGYNQAGFGVAAGAAIDGSFAIGDEGNQGYYVNGGKEIFISTVESMKSFFKKRAEILGGPIRYVIKPGIGGQHTPFQGIADLFRAVDPESGIVVGEYELGKDYEAALAAVLKKLGADWDRIAVIPSSKSGSTDETMMIFTEIFYVLLKNIAAKHGFDGRLFAGVVLKTMHDVNFINGKERAPMDLFKDFDLKLVQADLNMAGIRISYDQVKDIFGAVLGNMFFETTDRPDQSRLSAFIRNSGLDKELGENAPGFGAMFDNVGGRWTADLHMMTFLAYYDLSAEDYWNTRYEGIKKVREGSHQANTLGNKILDEGITDIALIVPDKLFWFGKAMEQNFNESIWQEGFANLIAVRQSDWPAQKTNYASDQNAMVIDIEPIEMSNPLRQYYADSLGVLFTTFYGMTHTVGNRLMARALAAKGFTPADVDLKDLDHPATKIFQQNLYLRQPYVELGKGLLEKKLKALQDRGPAGIEAESKRIQEAAKEALGSPEALKDMIKKAADLAKKEARKFVPFIYLEGEKFYNLREYLTKLGVVWVMQGTGDQHISYQQVLAQPQKYLPFIISVVPEKFLPGRPAVGFAKGYLDNVSPNMVRDLFAEASYGALMNPRLDEAGVEVIGAKGIFMRMTDSEDNRKKLAHSFEKAITP